jgi:integrase
VKLPQAVAVALRAHRDRQRFERERAGEHYQDNGLVFATFKGTPYEPSNIRRSFARLLKKHGLTGYPRLRIHDMRHTSGTIALAKRVPVKTVSKRLGHSSIRITLDIYAHVLDESAQEEADVMDDALAGEDTGEDIATK